MANELAGAQVGAPQTPAAPAAPQGLPSPFADVASGALSAISLAPIQGEQPDPAQAFAVENFDGLANAGLDYHEIPETNESVIFNPDKITTKQIEEAYEAGNLHEIAPLVTDLVPVGGAAAPGAELAPGAPAGPLQGATAGGGALQGARLRNVAPAPKNAPNPVPGVLAKRAL
jgi:hypothetical protein